MDWMYNETKENPEDYLLGRSIDKNFNKKTSPERFSRFEKLCTNVSKNVSTELNYEDPLRLMQKQLEHKICLKQQKYKKLNEQIEEGSVSSQKTDRVLTEIGVDTVDEIMQHMMKMTHKINVKNMYEILMHEKTEKETEDGLNRRSMKRQVERKERRRSSSSENIKERRSHHLKHKSKDSRMLKESSKIGNTDKYSNNGKRLHKSKQKLNNGKKSKRRHASTSSSSD